MLNELFQNGMGASISSNSGLNSVCVSVDLRIGALDEATNSIGVSHYLEHMMFKIKNKAKKEEMHRSIMGISSFYNGITRFDNTLYYIYSHKKNLNASLNLLAEMLFDSQLPEEEFEKERNVIKNEIIKFDDSISQWFTLRYMPGALYAEKRLDYSIIGNERTLSEIEFDELLKFQKAFYTPGNSYIGIYGGVEAGEALSLAKECFSSITSNKTAKSKLPKPKERPREIRLEKQGLKQALVAIGFATLGYADFDENFKDKICLDIIKEILSERLVKELREKTGISYEMNVDSNNYYNFGYLSCMAGMEKADLEKGQEIILRECNKLGHGEITNSEFSSTTDKLIMNFQLEAENSAQRSTKSAVSGLMKHPNMYDSYDKKIGQISIGDLAEVAQKYLKENKHASVFLTPK